jgi:hypothetical protein
MGPMGGKYYSEKLPSNTLKNYIVIESSIDDRVSSRAWTDSRTAKNQSLLERRPHETTRTEPPAGPMLPREQVV